MGTPSWMDVDGHGGDVDTQLGMDVDGRGGDTDEWQWTQSVTSEDVHIRTGRASLCRAWSLRVT